MTDSSCHDFKAAVGSVVPLPLHAWQQGCHDVTQLLV